MRAARHTAAAGVRLIVWCKECQHQVEPDPAEMPVCTAPSSYLITVTVHTDVAIAQELNRAISCVKICE